MKGFISLFFIAILFVSCSSDDNKNTKPNIVGSWTLTALNAAIPIDLNNDGTANRNIMNEISCFEGHGSFTADGNYLLTLSQVENTETNGVMVFDCMGSIVNTGKYTLEGDQLTTIPDNPDEATTTTTIYLNNDTLKTSMDAGDFGRIEFVLRRD